MRAVRSRTSSSAADGRHGTAAPDARRGETTAGSRPDDRRRTAGRRICRCSTTTPEPICRRSYRLLRRRGVRWPCAGRRRSPRACAARSHETLDTAGHARPALAAIRRRDREPRPRRCRRAVRRRAGGLRAARRRRRCWTWSCSAPSTRSRSTSRCACAALTTRGVARAAADAAARVLPDRRCRLSRRVHDGRRPDDRQDGVWPEGRRRRRRAVSAGTAARRALGASRLRSASAPGCCRRSSTRTAARSTIASQARASSVCPHDSGRVPALVLTRLAVFVCTFGYIGYFPSRPARWGRPPGSSLYAAAALAGRAARRRRAVIAAAVRASASGAARTRSAISAAPIPGPGVIDEVVGMLITLFMLPADVGAS